MHLGAAERCDVKDNMRKIICNLGNQWRKSELVSKMLNFKTGLLIMVLKISWKGILLEVKITLLVI